MKAWIATVMIYIGLIVLMVGIAKDISALSFVGGVLFGYAQFGLHRAARLWETDGAS